MPSTPSPSLLARLNWYWIFQLAGWNGAALLSLATLSRAPLSAAIVGVSWCGAATGLLLSMAWRRVLRRHGWIAGRFAGQYIVPSLLLIALLQSLLAGASYVLLQPFGPVTSWLWLPSAMVSWFGIFLLWTILYAMIIALRRASRLEAETLCLEVLAKDAELRALQAQVNPHFFFNSLNSVRALVFEDRQAAADTLDRLAALMRHALNAGRHDTVMLADELGAVRAYLEIEAIRFEARLAVRFEIAPGLDTTPIPPMSLQTLVENAVRHGIEQQPDGGTIVLKAQHAAGGVQIVVANTGVLRTASGSTRLGLANARQRLQLALGSAASLSLAENDGWVRAELFLPETV